MWTLVFISVVLITTVRSQLYLRVGTEKALPCAALEEDDTYVSLVWYKDGVLIATLDNNLRVDIPSQDLKSKIKLSRDRDLVIQQLELKDSATYKCRLLYMDSNSTVGIATREETYDLRVQDVPSPPGRPEVHSIQSKQATVSWEGSEKDNNSPINAYLVYVRYCQKPQPVQVVEVSEDSLNRTVRGLKPYTCYVLTVAARNYIGVGVPSPRSREFYTAEEAPEKAPYHFQVTVLSSTKMSLEWEKPPPHTLNGELEGFEINYGETDDDMTAIEIDDPNRNHTVLEGLKPYTMYKIAIKAYNKVGAGPEVDTAQRTMEGVPSKPRITHIFNRLATSFYVSWEPPTILNGQLTKYELQWIRKDNNMVKKRFINGHLTNPMTAFITDLTPYTEYKVRVAAATGGGQGAFSDLYPALTDVTAPGVPRNLNITQLSPTAIHVMWDPPLVYTKQVDNYIIKWWDSSGDSWDKLVKGQVTEQKLYNLPRKSKFHLKVAAITNAIFSKMTWVGDFTDTLTFQLDAYGGDAILIVDKGPTIKKARSDDEDSLSAGGIVGIVFAVMVLLLVIGLVIGLRFYTCRKCYLAAYRYLAVPSNGQSVQPPIVIVEEHSGEKQYPDIAVNDFLAHVDNMHSDSDIGFAQEFDEINRTTKGDKYGHDSSSAAENKNKNRYFNIVAYDHSRVFLKNELRPRQSDYINANYVDGYKKPKAYIATQGPLPATFSDFWRMVWEQNTTVIVMITNLLEKGRRKCDQYWPNDGMETYGNMSVKLITTVPRAHYTVRIFSLRNLKVKKRHSMKGAGERTVYHYHYTEWPDHGVPDYCLPVLSFVQKSAAQSGPDAGPIVVHCSAGVGRTGTYILIDTMIAQIQDKGTINIPGFTHHIRRQRNFLVQTEEQYIFIHKVLVEYLQGGGTTEVQEEHMRDFLSELEKPPKSVLLHSFKETSLLGKQFELVASYAPSEMDWSAALKPINQEKNRANSFLPVNLKRVLLPARPGVEGSDYINATYLQGYKKSNEFIVTQHPTEATMEDFWRMVWDKNSPVIIVLSPFDEEQFKEFWPPKDSSIEVDAGNFRLAMKEEPNPNGDQGFVLFEFILDSIQYDYTLLTRIMCLRDWPDCCTDLNSVFDIIVAAHNFVNSIECGPVVVMDRFGGVEAGKFCALWTLRDQVLSEKCADIYQVTKLYHYKRPGIIGCEEDYLYLYQAMACLCDRLMEEQAANGASPRHHHHHHFGHSHHGSIRRNGTLPRPSNGPVLPNANSNSNSSNSTLPRSGTNGMKESLTTPTDTEEKDETDI